MNKSSGGIGLRPKLGPKGLTVLPLPRGEGWGEGKFTLSPHFVDPVTPYSIDLKLQYSSLPNLT
jgi:hypothetical protein